jgi:DNA (cytosine-5)-methyltransferase 1
VRPPQALALTRGYGRVDNSEEPLRVLSFCSGFGGLERGLDLAGAAHRVVAYVEIEAFAVAYLVEKMEKGELAPAPIYTDLKTFPAHLFRGRVDLITGGYPCQPFTTAGEKRGTDDPRHLWPFIWHHVAIIYPARVFFENVTGHISMGLSTVIGDLEALGYLSTWGIFSAAEAGAPHPRKRVYIMADAERPRGPVGVSGPLGHQQEGQPEIADNAGGGRRRGESEVLWPPEPRVGRVVDGCADRIDRLRLLGNGVVRQTAAIAWGTLGNQLLTALTCSETLKGNDQ